MCIAAGVRSTDGAYGLQSIHLGPRIVTWQPGIDKNKCKLIGLDQLQRCGDRCGGVDDTGRNRGLQFMHKCEAHQMLVFDDQYVL